MLPTVNSSFWRSFILPRKTTSLRSRAEYAETIQGETSPPASSSKTGTAPILGTGKDNNEELDWWLQQTEGEGYLHYTAGAKVGLFGAADSREILGSRQPQGTILLCRGVRSADSLKIHLWQQSNEWLCPCSGPVLPPCGHSSSAPIELPGPRSPFIILSLPLSLCWAPLPIAWGEK